MSQKETNAIKGDNIKYSYIYEFWFYFIPLYNSFVTNVLVYPQSKRVKKDTFISLFFEEKIKKKFKKIKIYIFRVSVRCVTRYAKLQPIKHNRIQKYKAPFIV